MSEPRAGMPARWVSTEVIALAAAGARSGRVSARFESTLHLDVGGFVVAVLPPGAPRMPNGLSVAGALPRAPNVGDEVLLTRGGVRAGRLEISWDDARSDHWDARVAPWGADQRRRLRRRGEAILGTASDGPPARRLTDSLARAGCFGADDVEALVGLESLLAAVRSGDRCHAARAGRELAGRGRGLTPSGDDVLAATALTLAAAGPASGRRAWLAALVPRDLRSLTTSVSATLVELAVRGCAIGPARALLDPDPVDQFRLRRDLAAMRRLGHTSGAVYAATIGVVALVLAPDENHTHHDKENR